MYRTEGLEGWRDGWMGGDLNYCFLSSYSFSLLIYMDCIFLILSISLSLFLTMVFSVLLTHDYSFYSGGRRRGMKGERRGRGRGRGRGKVGGGAQSSSLSESRAVLILFVWPHTFPAFLSLFTAAVVLMILALASSFTPPASLLFFTGLLAVVFSSSW